MFTQSQKHILMDFLNISHMKQSTMIDDTQKCQPADTNTTLYTPYGLKVMSERDYFCLDIALYENNNRILPIHSVGLSLHMIQGIFTWVFPATLQSPILNTEVKSDLTSPKNIKLDNKSQDIIDFQSPSIAYFISWANRFHITSALILPTLSSWGNLDGGEKKGLLSICTQREPIWTRGPG